MQLADALSHCPARASQEIKLDMRVDYIAFTKPCIEKLKDSMQRDPILATVYQLTQQGWPHQRRHVPCVTAAGSFMVWPRGFPQFRRVWNSEYTHRVRKTLTSCQQNPILFGQAGLTTPTRLGFLFWLTFPVTSWCNGNYDSNTKCKGRWYGPNDSSQCRLHRDSDAINSIINSKAALFDKENSEDLRNSSRRAHGWTNMADSSIGSW